MALLDNVVPYTIYLIAQHEVDTGVVAILAATAPLFALIAGHLTLLVSASLHSLLCSSDERYEMLASLIGTREDHARTISI